MAAVKERFVFMRSIYAPQFINDYGAWVGFSVPAAEVIDSPSFEVALEGVYTDVLQTTGC